MAKSYNPLESEKIASKKWERSGYFNPDKLPNSAKRKKRFVISMPPPNATGTLHLGHAIGLTNQDIMVRYHRMKGEQALWVPGTDHATIATQNRVEKELKKEGKTRFDLGRAAFIKRVHEFIAASQQTIKNQITKLGASCDWSRERYTLDDGLSKAVIKNFVNMYRDGLIYRGYRIVNWCPRCGSTLADDEVEYEERDEKLYYIKYGPLTLATVRPETKFGDTAVAVHPRDRRYKKYIGKTIDIETVLGPAKIKVVADDSVDPKFGTGAVKVTPAHDPADFAIGERHHLEIKKVIDEHGRLNHHAGKFAGLPTLEAREKIVAEMKQKGLLAKEEPYRHNVSVCYRCGTTIEPLTSNQWFVDVNKPTPVTGKNLKELSIAAVKSGQIKIIPTRFSKIYYHWMNNLHDWCISRQLWFGHRVPVWYKDLAKPVMITYFVHGSTKDNEKSLATGHRQDPLSPLGIRQAEELRNKIKKESFDLVIVSDLKRAKETAEIVWGKNFITDKRLREIDYGKLTKTKISDKAKEQYLTKSYPGGESYEQVKERINNLLNELAAKYPGKRVALLGHQAPQLALEHLLNYKSLSQAFASDWRKQHAWQPGWSYELKRLTYVGETPPADKNYYQDPDTLDTWFSSALWTFSTLGWPAKTKDLKRFHPTSVLETGYDILFFWVARMIMMSQYALNQVPFYNVYLHGLIRTKSGEKMSKSKPETMIDPLDMINKYGTDALRLSLIAGTSPGNDIRIYEEKIANFRNFANKLWNTVRFATEKENKKTAARQTLADRWIESRLNKIIASTTANLDKFNFGEAADDLYHFLWHDFADWYIEASKLPGFTSSATMQQILKKTLKLLHPFTPFVTETLWNKLGEKELLMVAPWPQANQTKIDNSALTDFAKLQDLIVKIRNIASEYKIAPTKKITIHLKQTKLLTTNRELIERLGRCHLEFTTKAQQSNDGLAILTTAGKIYVNLKDYLDLDREKQKTEEEIKKLKVIFASLDQRLKNHHFLKQAPAEVVAKEKERYKILKEKLRQLETRRAALS